MREIGGSGPILGGWEDSVWEDREVRVGPDEMLLMYTDGVTDTRGAAERFGATRLRRLLVENAGSSPEQLLQTLQATLEAFQTEGHADDTGAVALRAARVESLVPAAEGAGRGTETLPGELP